LGPRRMHGVFCMASGFGFFAGARERFPRVLGRLTLAVAFAFS
jgi:hypothetical protein